jgi:hydrogenase maturation protease
MTRAGYPEAAQRKVLVIALGNPDRGDDGIGGLVAKRLAGRVPEQVTLLSHHRDVLSLIEDWAGFDALVCVDAAAPMGEVGRIHRIDLATTELPAEMSFTSGHAFGLAEAVRLARALGRAPHDIIVYAVEGGCFDAGTPMTAAVAAAADEVADRIIGELAA